MPTIMSNSTKNWYSLYTKAGSERKVASILTRKNIDNYCPLKRHWNGRKILVSEPLFISFVFVQLAEADMLKIRMIEGVLNFVYWLGKPAVIKAEEIETMKRFMSEYIDVKVEKLQFNLDGGGMARVIGGSEEGFNAPKVAMNNNEVSILLTSLGYRIFAEAASLRFELEPVKTQSRSTLEKYQLSFRHLLSFQ
jgi:transcription antitermination factor NusG